MKAVTTTGGTIEFAFEERTYRAEIPKNVTNKWQLKESLCQTIGQLPNNVRIYESGPGAYFQTWPDDRQLLTDLPSAPTEKLLLYSNLDVHAIPYVASLSPPMPRWSQSEMIIVILLILVILWFSVTTYRQ